MLTPLSLAASHRHFGDPERRDDDQVVGMHSAFRVTGGVLPIDEVRILFQRHGGPVADGLAECIRKREAIAFDWRQETWLPMFQFSRKTRAVHPSLKPVLRELSTVYDGWETANWFALRNTWLAGRAPVDMLTRDLSAVLYAARVDRFIALGDVNCAMQPLSDAPADRPSRVSPFAEVEEVLPERRHSASSTAAHN